MKITVNHDFGRLAATVKGWGKQIPFATAVALTRTAQRVKHAEEREMKDVFERPTPYTLQSVFMKPATKASQEAVVWLKDFAGKGTPASKFLLPQIKGGSRRPKRFEKALQAVGAMPPDHRAVPGEGAKVDAFGNMDRGQIVQILSFFKAFPEMGYKANMSDKRRKQMARGTKSRQGFSYFVGRPGDRLPLGIWQRVSFARGSAIKPVLIFVPSVTYNAAFDFVYVGKTVFNRHFHEEFRRALDQAIRTAR